MIADGFEVRLQALDYGVMGAYMIVLVAMGLILRRQAGTDLEGYFAALYPDPSRGDPARAKSTRMTLHGLFEMGMGQDLRGVRGSWWAAWNAVTEYSDHHAGNDARRRLEGGWLGDGARLKQRAWGLAIDLAQRPHGEPEPMLN